MKTLLLTLLMVLSVGGIALADSDTIAIQTIILEAQGESLEGQIAIGEVIRNRTDDVYTHGSYAERVEQVVRRPNQFSCWNSPLIAKLRLYRVDGQTWQRASKAWELSKNSDLTCGATHYLALSSLKRVPKWVKSMKKTAIIGNHTFYKEVA